MTADGGPAFPVVPPLDPAGGSAAGYPYPAAGMSLRDYFAGAALQGALAGRETWPRDGGAGACAHHCYVLADAMLDVRERAK